MKSLALAIKPASEAEKAARSDNGQELLRGIQRQLPKPIALTTPTLSHSIRRRMLEEQWLDRMERWFTINLVGALRDKSSADKLLQLSSESLKDALHIYRVGLMQARNAGGDCSKKSAHLVMDVFSMHI